VCSPKNGSFDFAEGLACRGGAKANVPLCVGCQRNFYFAFLSSTSFKIFVCQPKKNKTPGVGNVWSGLSSFVLSVMFCLIGHCQVVVLNVLSAGLLTDSCKI